MKKYKYSLGLRIIHWLMAFITIWMIYSGIHMKSLQINSEIKFRLYAIHKAFGITILGLAIVRVFFRTFTHIPPLPENSSRFMINASKTVHFVLYLLMILLPVSGYIMSSASNKEIKYFFYIPLLISENKKIASMSNYLHSILAYFMIVFITLHIIGTLKHVFIDKQNIFKRIV